MKSTIQLAAIAILALCFAGCETQADKDRRANAEMQFQTAVQVSQNELCQKLDHTIVEGYSLAHPNQAATKANMAKMRAYETRELAKSNCHLGDEPGTENLAFANVVTK
jgi:hypothetical protein